MKYYFNVYSHKKWQQSFVQTVVHMIDKLIFFYFCWCIQWCLPDPSPFFHSGTLDWPIGEFIQFPFMMFFFHEFFRCCQMNNHLLFIPCIFLESFFPWKFSVFKISRRSINQYACIFSQCFNLVRTQFLDLYVALTHADFHEFAKRFRINAKYSLTDSKLKKL